MPSVAIIIKNNNYKMLLVKLKYVSVFLYLIIKRMGVCRE